MIPLKSAVGSILGATGNVRSRHRRVVRPRRCSVVVFLVLVALVGAFAADSRHGAARMGRLAAITTE